MIPSAKAQRTYLLSSAGAFEPVEHVRLSRFIDFYRCAVGSHSIIGPFVEIQRGTSVRSQCKVSSQPFIRKGVFIGDRCFVGHGVVLTNDLTPRATNPQANVKPQKTG